jgi:hypothetical protein
MTGPYDELYKQIDMLKNLLVINQTILFGGHLKQKER